MSSSSESSAPAPVPAPGPSSASEASTPAQETIPYVCRTNKKFPKVKEDNRMFGALTIAKVGDQPTFWGLQIRNNLSWFNQSRYASNDNIRDACNGWDDICGVEFKEARRPDDAFILVRDATEDEENEPNNRGVLASAFFPGEAIREIIIYRAYAKAFYAVSILMHELGHVLGFRHEHIWANLTGEPVKFKQDGKQWDAQQLTRYDPDSIMHYKKIWDNVAAGKQTTLSPLDQMGAQLVYGQSSRKVRFL
eukprot:TRINITY_DN4722_c0_g2_i1.p1 TRINITY_DN4722_c0_g2~~TRINITY_DN4722_c0_g2_i1.p1  ORF type:complete len:250 (+),score=84.42 TRINITY_DN4722_c0_g2_i1:110-859(+)